MRERVQTGPFPQVGPFRATSGCDGLLTASSLVLSVFISPSSSFRHRPRSNSWLVDMYDPNLFAVLTACDLGDRARGAFALPANVHFFLAETGDFVQEPTPARPPSPEAASRLGHRILLHLDRLPKDPRRGWLFGTDPGVCDVVLGHPGTPGISREHFSITLDLQFQVEIFNWSRFGAAVRCNGGLRTPGSSKCKRLLSFEPGFSRGWEEVMVYVPNVDGLAFKIDFPNHRTGRREYRRNLRSFLRRCDAAPAPVRGWGLGSMASHSPLDALTVCYDDGAIGRSRFGLVRRLVDVHKGRLYAAKTFNVKGPTDENRRLREIGWFDGIEEDVAKVNKDPHVSVSRSFVLWPGLILREATRHAHHRVLGDARALPPDALLSDGKSGGYSRSRASAISQHCSPDAPRPSPPA